MDERWATILAALTSISRELPERFDEPQHPLTQERAYAKAGKVYALYEKMIFDAVNALRASNRKP